MTNRFGRVIDRSRALTRELQGASEEDHDRLVAQLRILTTRAKLVRAGIALAGFSVLLAALLVISLFLGALLQLGIVSLIVTLFVVCMLCLIASLLLFISDINLSLKALWLEMSWPSNAKSLLLLFCALALPVFAGCAAMEKGTASKDGFVAFTSVDVVPMTREIVLPKQTVLVRDGAIVEMGPESSVRIPPGARRIDGGGRWLLPGLTDFHVHLRSTDELLSYLAHGVTTIVNLSGATSGAPDLLRYRDELARGERLGPTLYTTGRTLDGDPPIFASVSTVVRTPEEARRAVAEQHAAGYDFIKVYNNLAPDVLAAVVKAAHERGLAVVGHIPRAAGRAQALQQALATGQDMIAHGEEYFFTFFHAEVESRLDRGEIPHPDEELIPEAVRLTREAGAAVTPNLSFVAMTRRQLDDLAGVLADPEARYLHPDVRAMWVAQNPTKRADRERFDRRERAKYPFLQALTRALGRAGVPLLLGTDASIAGLFPGASAHLELRELVAAGLTPYEALASGTRNAGAFIAKRVAGAEPFGVVAPGQRADLLLVRGNPLEDVASASAIDGVMARGRWLPSTELERMRDKVADSRRNEIPR